MDVNRAKRTMIRHLKSAALPLLLAITPLIFLYSHNSQVLVLDNLLIPVLLAVLAALLFYSLFYLAQRNPVSASLSASFMIGANFLYGIVFRKLTNQDLFPVRHYVLLPITLYCAYYAAYFFNFIRSGLREAIQKILTVMVAALVAYNVIAGIPTEIRKFKIKPSNSMPVSAAGPDASKKYPDVYFIMLDEYAGFEPVRDYWKKDYVNDFERFLRDNDFFIIENARSATTSTFVELASRLNMRQYPGGTDHLQLVPSITDNKVMKLFKQYGYTTVVFRGPFPEYNADYNFPSPTDSDTSAVGTGEFNKVLIENSMLYAFSDRLQRNDSSARRLAELNQTFEKISDLSEIQSPKLVIAHLYIPHVTFVTDKDGNPLDTKYQYDWNYYIGQHEYATKQTQALILRILKQADPENPPVIVIESDHGARNQDLASEDSIELLNYPDKYSYYILFAMHLPGVDTSDLTDTTSPIETFAIVLNKYFNAGVTIEKMPPGE